MLFKVLLLCIPLTASPEKADCPSVIPVPLESSVLSETANFMAAASWNFLTFGGPALLDFFDFIWTQFKFFAKSIQRLAALLSRSLRGGPRLAAAPAVPTPPTAEFRPAMAVLALIEHRAGSARTCEDLVARISDSDLEISSLSEKVTAEDFLRAFRAATEAVEARRRVVCGEPLKSGLVIFFSVLFGLIAVLASSKFFQTA